ncbi:hypothetical protein YN1_2720 [Nanoarchaeota archaeon]
MKCIIAIKKMKIKNPEALSKSLIKKRIVKNIIAIIPIKYNKKFEGDPAKLYSIGAYHFNTPIIKLLLLILPMLKFNRFTGFNTVPVPKDVLFD